MSDKLSPFPQGMYGFKLLVCSGFHVMSPLPWNPLGEVGRGSGRERAPLISANHFTLSNTKKTSPAAETTTSPNGEVTCVKTAANQQLKSCTPFRKGDGGGRNSQGRPVGNRMRISETATQENEVRAKVDN